MSENGSTPAKDPYVLQDESLWPGVVIRVQKMTVRDGMEMTRLNHDIVRRYLDDEEGQFDAELTVLVQHYPIIVVATEKAKGVPWPLSEEDFWNLPEDLVLAWADQCREVNPQHNLSFLDLKKLLTAQSPALVELLSLDASDEPNEIETP